MGRGRHSYDGRIGLVVSLVLWLIGHHGLGAERQAYYYAHEAVLDKHGVIAPWYRGQNGLIDLRVQVAAEFLKRYPWADTSESVMAGPHWIFNARVDMNEDGAITVLPATDMMNGNLGQRFKYITESMIRYYRYTGDPSVFGYLRIAADFLLDHYMTPSEHPWPGFPISVPMKGSPYGPSAPGGWIQLDLSAGIGLGFLRAYQMTGDRRYLEAAKHIGGVFANKCNLRPGTAPWNRYAEQGEAPWCEKSSGNILTGGVANILIFLEELMRVGYYGEDDLIVKARDAGLVYLRDTLLPAWAVNETWGRHYWDWENPVQGILPTGWVAQYLMDHKDAFPNWKRDVRNILGLYLNHATVSPESRGEVYSGAWAYPEGSSCCGPSLDICPIFLARFWARFGREAQSEWALEIARRKTILSFYHFHRTGKVEDNISGGQITAQNWSELIGLGPILVGLETMGWLPEILGPNRENHMVRSTAVVNNIVYAKGRIRYSTFDAPDGTIDILRLAFAPSSVKACAKPLPRQSHLDENGYSVKALEGHDQIVSIRHDGCTKIVLEGSDPQEVINDDALSFRGAWAAKPDSRAWGGGIRVAQQPGSEMTCTFTGNQFRLIGSVAPSGGLADVYLDGVRQAAGIDFWSPRQKHQQVLHYKSGLGSAEHELRVVLRGEGNPLSRGNEAYIDALQYSDATGDSGFGEGGGPTGFQRLIFGYAGREDYVDSAGNSWRPATEFVARTGRRTDSVAKTWWTMKQATFVKGTPDEELYRYGVHWSEFVVNLTVGPGTYFVRLKFAENQFTEPNQRAFTISINDETVAQAVDIFATAGEAWKAVDLVFNNIQPQNGVIEIRFKGEEINGRASEAMVQAIEVGPASADAGTAAKTTRNYLRGTMGSTTCDGC